MNEHETANRDIGYILRTGKPHLRLDVCGQWACTAATGEYALGETPSIAYGIAEAKAQAFARQMQRFAGYRTPVPFA